MHDYLDTLVESVKNTINEGYYNIAMDKSNLSSSLIESIQKCPETAIISEIKFVSPYSGKIREQGQVADIAKAMEKGGAVGISVITEPKHFKGSLENAKEARKAVTLPILMKDLIISPTQINAASKTGASVVLLMQNLFDRGYCELNIHRMIDFAHSKRLEVLLEVHTRDELNAALITKADMIGINNRNLKTMKVDLEVTKRILTDHRAIKKIVVSESGIRCSEDIKGLKEYGVNAFLIGTTIIKDPNIEEKLKELIQP